MIKIFNATDRNFSSGGNIIIEPTKCLEYKKKSLNGWYIEVELPIKYKDYIEEDKLCVIQTKSKLNPQAFRINQDLKKTNRKITFTANHVMFDMERYFLLDVRPTNLNGLNALNYINQRTDNVSPFSFYSDVENISTAYFIRKNMLEACEIIEERWGGVFDADNWNISFWQNVGNDNGESVIYGKNMQDMEIYEDWSAVVTRLYPVGYDGLMLPEQYLESQINYDVPYTRTIDFQTELEEEDRTAEKLTEELRGNAREYINENQYPKVSYTTKSDINDNMEIGDTIQVKHPLVTITTEVLEYVYNVVSKKIKELTFGNYSRDVKAKFNNIKNTIKSITQEVSNQQIVINQQTELINLLNKNGYVYIDDNEILILDELPKENAHNVWRWGLGGLGFSSNGYEGPFETAITMDGKINANFITTGVLSVSRIEGLANTLDEYGSNITAINLELGRIESSISDIADITTSLESNSARLEFENINQSEPVRVVIHPTGTNIAKLHPSPSLKPKVGLKIKTRILRFTNTTTNEVFNYEIPDDLLYYDSENYDEFILDYDSQTCVVKKKCKWNADGTVGLLSSTRTDEYTFPHIELTDGDYTIQVIQYSNAYLFARMMVKNYYTAQFATRAELNSEISQTKEEIDLSVNQTLSNYSTTNEMNSAINLKANQINSEVSTIEENLQTVTLTADSKNRVFYTTPNPPYKLGDLWVQGESGDILRCQTAKASGSYSQSDWVLASKYTDDTYAEGVQSNLSNLENTISADYYTKTETDAQININTNNINSVVTEVSTLKTTVNNNYTSLKGELENYATTENVEVISKSVQALQTSTNYYIGLTQDIQENGVSKVTTEKGFTFDNDGLTIDETNAKTKSNLDTDGLVVIDKTSSNNEILLQAGYDENTGETIVKSKNMTVEKYLSIGAYSRIEDYEDQMGNKGTAIFWTGG